MDANWWDVIIVGGGGAGLSAALTLGRARRRVLVVDAGSPRNRFAEHTHGLLGHEGVHPAELLTTGRDEVLRHGVTFVRDAVEWVDDVPGGLRVRRADGSVARSRALIAASGLSDELPDLPGLLPRWGKTVLHCPYCHGWEVRGRRLGVLAASPFGLQQAKLIRQWSEQVVFFTAQAGPLDAATRHALTARGITLVDAPVVEILGAVPRLTGVRTAADTVVELDILFTRGNARAHDGFLDGLSLARSDTPFGSFLTIDPTGATSHPRVWAAGNVADPGVNVAMAISAGFRAAVAVNLALVTEDFDTAARTAADQAAPEALR